MGATPRVEPTHALIDTVHRIVVQPLVVHALEHVVSECSEGIRNGLAEESEQQEVHDHLTQQQSQGQLFGDTTQVAEVPSRQAGGNSGRCHQEAAGESGVVLEDIPLRQVLQVPQRAVTPPDSALLPFQGVHVIEQLVDQDVGGIDRPAFDNSIA
ncbi:hypothetical protein ACIQUV_02535 [Streptomyces globosus]|uniref:hypothetical protein n=1 Tax=Streptomyces TaxID=1883 RepID=UPI0033DD511D